MRKLALIVVLLCAVVALAKSVDSRNLGPPGQTTVATTMTPIFTPGTTSTPANIGVANRADPQEVVRNDKTVSATTKHTTLDIANSNTAKIVTDVGVPSAAGQSGKHEDVYHGPGRARLN